MRPIVDEILAASGGVATRAHLIGPVGRAALDDEIRRGRLTAVYPRAYCRPWDLDQEPIRRRAAVLSVGGDVALSHLTALDDWGLPVPDDDRLHATAYQPRHPRGVPGRLVVHRTLIPLRPRLRHGLPVVAPEVAIATSWPMLSGSAQRAPAIEASRRRIVTASALLDAAASAFWVPGVRDLRELIGAIVAGCESELELYGYLNVFATPGLDHAVRQRVIRIGGQTCRLDMAYERERVDVELDGRAYHASPDQWERDIARDLALATAGWQTIRFSHARLVNDPDGCRRDTLAVLAQRRAAGPGRLAG